MLEILHLTDLHLSTDNDLLSTAWMGVNKVIDGQTFNFVVISGDLTNKAHELRVPRAAKLPDRERRQQGQGPGTAQGRARAG